MGGDLFVRQTPRDEPEHVDLSGGQTGRTLTATDDPMPSCAENGLDDITIHPPRFHLRAQLLRRDLGRQRLTVGTRLAHGLVGVSCPQHTGRYGDGSA